jgi:hypothetical protein
MDHPSLNQGAIEAGNVWIGKEKDTREFLVPNSAGVDLFQAMIRA